MATTGCSICASEESSLRISPTSCSKSHEAYERACHECWEAHLSYQIEELNPRNIECLFCDSKIDRTELKRLARKYTVIRYDSKIRDATRQRCQARCAASIDHGLQSHEREVDGRVFICQFCHFQTCLDCNRPEHENETCQEYRNRVTLAPHHAQAEAETHKIYDRCPGCDIFFVLEGEDGKSAGCGYTQCTACGYRFCSRCLIPWVRESSAYLGGRQAHLRGCLYRTRDTDSSHALKYRFAAETEEERSARLKEREEVKAEQHEAKAEDKRRGRKRKRSEL